MRLDNAAKIYPAVKTRRWTALFRLSAEFDHDIDVELLAEAQKRTLARFPGFACRLRRGMFWYYLERQQGEPEIQKDVANPCVRMDLRENGGFMFRVRYYRKRIALEIFHVVTDGTGGLIFLKTLIAEYAELYYGIKVPRGGGILDCAEEADEEELTDAYERFSREVAMSRNETPAYRIRGTETQHFMNIVSGIIPAEEVAAEAKRRGVSVTELLTAVLIMSVYDLQKRERSAAARKRPVKICVPVNLRQYYDTRTLRNFAMYVNPGIDSAMGEYTFEETLSIVHHYMRLETTEKKMNARMTVNVRDAKSPVLRAVPLFVKNPIMRLVYQFEGDRASSTILSNLGLVTLPEELSAHVTRLDFMLGSLYQNRVTCAVTSYNGNMIVNFTRAIEECDVPRGFFTRLVRLGIHVKVESNQR